MTEQDQDPIAAFTGEPSQALTREGRAMQRLQDWLARPLWSGACNPIGSLPWPEGVCILAGLDPEASADADPAGWVLLPGALAFYGLRSFPRDRHEAMQLGVAAEEQIGLLIGLGLRTAKPDRWIRRARGEGISIPWQGALKWHSAAGEAPVSILKNPGQSGASPQSKGGKHRPDDEIVAIFIAAALHENGVKPPRIVKRLKEMNLPGRRDAVGRWLEKMGDPKQGPGADALVSSTGRTREELEGLRAKAVSRTEKLRSSS